MKCEFLVGMDWFHCNQCFRREGTAFFVTSCGHILCQNCAKRDHCGVCETACKYLALSDNMKPQEKMYFKGLKETALKYFDHIAQVASFQKQQTERLISFYKKELAEVQAAVQEALLKISSQDRELKALKKENGELKSLLVIVKESLNKPQSCSRSSTPRPVAITSPSQQVTPRHGSQHSSQVVSRCSSAESIHYRVSRSAGQNQPTPAVAMQGSATPLVSNNVTPTPGSAQGRFHRIPSSSILLNSAGVNLLGHSLGARGETLQNQGSPHTPDVYRAQMREAGNTQATNNSQRTDRLNPIQLRFTPRAAGTHLSSMPSSRARMNLV
ncbi:RING finger protein 212B isoform X1 [Rhinatrema bivittatum]|uniref:RING finger protein 212B isoform X1 n=2 Tax=Rhinatrema bivittatum TaxID=194408 RepID=UPI00112883DA|nr:RING finger protein 212B isoform X1 [Rhinatrema bivittatum]